MVKETHLTNKYKAVVIGGSAGSFQPMVQILSSIPREFPLPIFLCLHRLKHVRHGFVEALSIKSQKEIVEPMDKENIKKGIVYLAPANYHMAVELGNSVSLNTEELINNSRPAIDITFESAAYVYRDKLIGILLSGANKDGAAGMQKIKLRKGLTIIQDIEESMINAMPLAAKNIVDIDYELKVDEIIDFLLKLNKIYQQ
ncbi:chemotaxis response regulator containing a CheY-like receiver domain and a methylesterase domain [Bernardetia litoralis DSM 6794]|uniref:protein-glutamate methylesterase n=1 Tax=Bernardetia litoralis (strain ATCC 23117 / DSM 6794 / NBRC 15988 / NCIMB 1366 / Fx l1 / Sio-4) TaxID=880071 RepID=I4AN85_BERLS|nr:chemotaxis protein CheB [Bernardetia litoralis]AFM05420.1 chemotaxis response regulator containing a CheY-like receiver domain and a methylesterase domain [Bernardetia litoralis DSM 6794]